MPNSSFFQGKRTQYIVRNKIILEKLDKYLGDRKWLAGEKVGDYISPELNCIYVKINKSQLGLQACP